MEEVEQKWEIQNQNLQQWDLCKTKSNPDCAHIFPKQLRVQHVTRDFPCPHATSFPRPIPYQQVAGGGGGVESGGPSPHVPPKPSQNSWGGDVWQGLFPLPCWLTQCSPLQSVGQAWLSLGHCPLLSATGKGWARTEYFPSPAPHQLLVAGGKGDKAEPRLPPPAPDSARAAGRGTQWRLSPFPHCLAQHYFFPW